MDEEAWRTLRWLAQTVAKGRPLHWDEGLEAIMADGMGLGLRDISLVHRDPVRRSRLQGRSGAEVAALCAGSVDDAPERIDVEPSDGLWLQELIASTVDLFEDMAGPAASISPDLVVRHAAVIDGIEVGLEMVPDGPQGPAWAIILAAPDRGVPVLRLGHWEQRGDRLAAVLPLEQRTQGMPQVEAFFQGIVRLVAGDIGRD